MVDFHSTVLLVISIVFVIVHPEIWGNDLTWVINIFPMDWNWNHHLVVLFGLVSYFMTPDLQTVMKSLRGHHITNPNSNPCTIKGMPPNHQHLHCLIPSKWVIERPLFLQWFENATTRTMFVTNADSKTSESSNSLLETSWCFVGHV